MTRPSSKAARTNAYDDFGWAACRMAQQLPLPAHTGAPWAPGEEFYGTEPVDLVVRRESEEHGGSFPCVSA
jgi:hypothetical protein